jgi:putative RNA 2'-phosphotransferase
MNLSVISDEIVDCLKGRGRTFSVLLDEHGWASTDKLIRAVRTKYLNFDKSTLEEVVYVGCNNLLAFNSSGSLIRANSGHAFPVDTELEELDEIPKYLWHSSKQVFFKSIRKNGLVSKDRNYVQLTTSAVRALSYVSCSSNATLYRINALAMQNRGFKFYKSRTSQHTILVSDVPTRFLALVRGEALVNYFSKHSSVELGVV